MLRIEYLWSVIPYLLFICRRDWKVVSAKQTIEAAQYIARTWAESG
jgi:hypothetical protein